MRNRLFLLALVAVLLLLQAGMRSAAQATPFHGGSTIGGISFWELRGALPLGIFAAGILLVSIAGTAQCLQAALQWSKGRRQLEIRAGRISSAALWCGAPLMAMCPSTLLPCIFPWLYAYDPDGWQTLSSLQWVLHGSIILLIICRGISMMQRPAVAVMTLSLSLFCLLAIGQMGFNHAFLILPTAAMGTAGMLMLLGKGRKWAFIPLLTAIGMNAALFYLTALPDAATPAAAVIYGLSLVLLSLPFGLKLGSLHH